MKNNTMELQLVKAEHFGEVQTDIYSDNKNMYMTTEQIGECLGYGNPRTAINTLVTRNPSLRNNEFSVDYKLKSTDGKAYNTRLFNEDGIYEVSFLSKTQKAQEFRRWVRGILKSLRTGELKLTQENFTITPEVIELAIEKHFGAIQKDLISHIDQRMNTMQNSFIHIKNLLEQNGKPLIDSNKEWKTRIYELADKIVMQQPDTYKDSKDVLHTLYRQLNKVYGIVWDREQFEYRKNHNISGNARTMELIGEKETLKSIAENILKDMIINESEESEQPRLDIVRSTIAPLIEKYNDKSVGGNKTFQIVYKNMNCGWSNLMTRYRKEHGTKNSPSKFKIVQTNPAVFRKYKKTVKQLLNEN